MSGRLHSTWESPPPCIFAFILPKHSKNIQTIFYSIRKLSCIITARNQEVVTGGRIILYEDTDLPTYLAFTASQDGCDAKTAHSHTQPQRTLSPSPQLARDLQNFVSIAPPHPFPNHTHHASQHQPPVPASCTLPLQSHPPPPHCTPTRTTSAPIILLRNRLPPNPETQDCQNSRRCRPCCG